MRVSSMEKSIGDAAEICSGFVVTLLELFIAPLIGLGLMNS